MNNKFDKILQSILPFIAFGVMIAISVVLFIFFSYLLIWGIIIGFFIWVFAIIRSYFSSPKPKNKPKKGRVIEHEDRK